jgi:acid stress-induced BolA-like protein IbaG/YrbA
MFKHPFKNNKKPLNGLQHIQKKLHQQQQILSVVQQSLTKDLAAHCLHISGDNKNILLFTDSSAWASKLLYMRQTILNTLSKHFGERVHGLKVKVLTQQIPSTEKTLKLPSSKTLKSLSKANSSQQPDSLNTSMNKLIYVLKKNKLTDLD